MGKKEAAVVTEEPSNDNGMFELALRKKLRWVTSRGLMSLEELWEIPLTSKDGFNLDAIGLAAEDALAAHGRSLVKRTKSPDEALASLRFDIVKYVISTKVAEDEDAKTRASNKKELEKLLKIKEERQNQELLGIDGDELDKRIAALR